MLLRRQASRPSAKREPTTAARKRLRATGPLPSQGNERNAPIALGQTRAASAQYRSVAHPGHRPRRAHHPRRCRPRGGLGNHGQRWRARDRTTAPLRRRRHSARPDAAEDRREYGPRGQRCAACHRAVRGGFLGHRRAQGGDGGEGREAQLHRLSHQGRGRGDGGRACDQRPLGRGPDRGLADASTSASAPRSARRAWSCPWSRTPAR